MIRNLNNIIDDVKRKPYDLLDFFRAQVCCAKSHEIFVNVSAPAAALVPSNPAWPRDLGEAVTARALEHGACMHLTQD